MYANIEGEERQNECLICYREYDGAKHELHPIIIFCGHSVCRECINKILVQASKSLN
jgi:hypothetical protein